MALERDLRMHEIQYCGEEIISFAQNCEDILIFRAFRGKRGGSFFDIGAGHPMADNVTMWLRMMGWTGVNIEPNPIFFNALEAYRSDDINLNVGISDHQGELAFYQVIQNEVGHGWGLSSFDPSSEKMARGLGFDVQHLTIPVTTLASITQELKMTSVDVLKIDVEGLEKSILSSTDWHKFRPKLICIEAVEPNSARPSWPRWESYLIDSGYDFAIFDGVNAYYTAQEEADIRGQLTAGVNCCDKWRRATSDDFPPPRG